MVALFQDRACDWSTPPAEIGYGPWRALSGLYPTPADVDLFTAGLLEAPHQGGIVGRTFSCLIARQFEAIKFGDRFFFSLQEEYDEDYGGGGGEEEEEEEQGMEQQGEDGVMEVNSLFYCIGVLCFFFYFLLHVTAVLSATDAAVAPVAATTDTAIAGVAVVAVADIAVANPGIAAVVVVAAATLVAAQSSSITRRSLQASKRDGDATNDSGPLRFNLDQVRHLLSRGLGDVVCDNTGLREVRESAFLADSPLAQCDGGHNRMDVGLLVDGVPTPG